MATLVCFGFGYCAEHFIAEFCAISHRAERVSEANKPVHFFFQRKMTSNAATHTLANQDR